MRYMREKMYCFLILLVLLFSCPVGVMAEEGNYTSDKIESRAEDVIIKKYRIFNGKLQYRRWNTYDECWIDPFWIDME